jgi:hypothetical protein
MKIEIILLLLLIHWVADFVMQTDKQAQGKANNFTDLVSHTLNYSLILWVGVMVLSKFDVWNCFYFFIITFIAHTFTDFFTSKINKSYWKRGKSHQFFVSVNFDQWLHYVQLFVTYKLLFL